MPIRSNSNSSSRFGVSGLQTGYGSTSSPDDLTVPAVGLEDVDVALFKLFDKEISLQVSTDDKNRSTIKKVPVLFASGEKWVMLKKGRGVRDRNGTLILPLVTIDRTTIQQTSNDDITGRGVNQQTGETIVKRRLDKSDRGYQSLINRLLLKHQLNLAITPSLGPDDTQLSTTRSIGDLSDDPTIEDGGFLMAEKSNNIYETLTLPTPQFYTAVYEVTFWTQYTVQMIQMIEQLMSSFLPQGQQWRLDTDKGYWFLAGVDENIYNAENNFDDMSTEERIIKYKFTVKVPAYILASNVPGARVPIKRYVSAPIISFDLGVGAGELSDSATVDDPFLGSDDPTLPIDDSRNFRRDQRRNNSTRLYPSRTSVNPEDPAMSKIPRGQSLAKYKAITSVNKNGKSVTKYVRVITSNQHTGETVFSSDLEADGLMGGLTIIVTDD